MQFKRDFNVHIWQLQHVLEHVFLEEQVDSIKKLGDYVTQLARVGAGLGEFTFDKTLQ